VHCWEPKHKFKQAVERTNKTEQVWFSKEALVGDPLSPPWTPRSP